MVKIKGKVFKVGNGYGIRLSKLWINEGIIKEGEELEVELPFDLRNKNEGTGI
ncbi:MAG: AbrB/MazE/SpoVT family DNA-binding domain-containing protein [Candidatus Nanoarchaeia archaeon]